MNTRNCFLNSRYLKIGLFALVLCLAPISTFAENVYGQFSSFNSQTPGRDQAGIVIFEHTEAVHGLEVLNHQTIKITENGVYTIIATGAIGSKSLRPNPNVNFWINLNGVVVQSSNITQTAQLGSINNVSTHAILALKKGDKISFWLSASESNVGIMSNGEGSASAIISIFKY